MKENSESRLFRLAATFPTLTSRMRDAAPGEILPIIERCANASGVGEGCQQAALFLCWVWNPYAHDFNMAKAWPIWDSAHREAYQAWAKEPYWL